MNPHGKVAAWAISTWMLGGRTKCANYEGYGARYGGIDVDATRTLYVN